MKKFIVTEEQLRGYIERKKDEKVFGSIMEDLHKNSKFLNEQVSIDKAHQTVIENYRIKNLLSPGVLKMLVEHGLVDEKGQII